MPRRLARRVAHKSTGGVLPWTPEPVDPVGNPPHCLTPSTVAHLKSSRFGRGEERRAELFKISFRRGDSHCTSTLPPARRHSMLVHLFARASSWVTITIAPGYSTNASSRRSIAGMSR
jgi:hypothetical protein